MKEEKFKEYILKYEQKIDKDVYSMLLKTKNRTVTQMSLTIAEIIAEKFNIICFPVVHRMRGTEGEWKWYMNCLSSFHKVGSDETITEILRKKNSLQKLVLRCGDIQIC